jgi:RNA polymerase sigma-70 factor (ECF subfamily)
MWERRGSRLIDQLRSARARRERYVGEWLPEPLVTDPTPAEQAEAADSLSLAFLVLLESLSPQQRAAFLLREVFEYPYAEVAEFIGTDVDSTRHLVARARNHVRQRRPRYYASRRQREELTQFHRRRRARRPAGAGGAAGAGCGNAR